MKKLLSLLLVLSLIVTSSLVVYADDTDTSGSSPEVPVSEEDLEEVYSDLRITSNNLTAVLNASNDNVTYTTDDIYNLLLSLFNNGSNLSQNSLILHIKQLCQTINTSCNALVSNSTLIKSMLTNSDNTINIYDLVGDHLGNIASELELVLSSGTQISITELLNFVYQEIQSSNENLVTIQNMLSTLNATSSSINTHVNTISGINAAIQTNTLNTITAVNNTTTAINNLNDDLNNINWINGNVYGVSTSLDDAMNSVYLTVGQWVSKPRTLYIRFLSAPNDSVYWLYTNSYVNNSSRGKVPVIKFYYATGQEITYNVSYAYDGDSVFRSYVYFYNVPSNHDLIISLDFSDTTGLYTAYSNQWVRYISLTSQDAYYPMYYINSLNQKRVFDKFEYLYASDDLIAAKVEQQPYESQAIEDFTGNGSAAASTSDLGNLKSVSGTIKSGLASGGSVSNALAPFDANGGFWDWFKQDNYNNINNLSGSSNTLRSAPSQPDVIDFYTNNQLTLQGLLGGN